MKKKISMLFLLLFGNIAFGAISVQADWCTDCSAASANAGIETYNYCINEAGLSQDECVWYTRAAQCDYGFHHCSPCSWLATLECGNYIMD